jgi:2'-5' RNA ligase
MRLFFALWPDADTKTQIARVAAQLALAKLSRLVPADNYHLTLAFVGEAPSSRLPGLLKIGGVRRAPRCTIAFDATEFWPKSRAVVAAAQEIPAGLLEFWEQLHRDLALKPQHKLRAHVTLARKVAQAPVLQAMSPIVWRTSSFGLYRSDTSGVESAYTVVDTWPLLDETQNP